MIAPSPGHSPRAEAQTDAQLLDRFTVHCDQAAFEALVRRHGPMVLRACQRLGLQTHDAEDVFQATFVLLTRKAASVARMDSIGGWLHGVAYRVALRARTGARKRGAKEERCDDIPGKATAGGEATSNDLRPMLDEELGHIAEKYRAPLVLCYLEGRSTAEAAQQLGCPRGTVLSRLSRGRDQLRSRLARRGLAFSAGALGVALAQETATAAVPSLATTATVQAAALLNGGNALPAGVLSAQACGLADMAARAMAWAKIRLWAKVLLILTTVSIAVSLLTPPKEETWQFAGAFGTMDTNPPPVLFAPEGRAIAFSGNAGMLRMRDLDVRNGVSPDPSVPYALAFSPDRRTLATVGSDNIGPTVVLRRRDTMRVLHELRVPNGFLIVAAFSSDGRLIAASGSSPGFGAAGSVKIWDVASGRELLTLAGAKYCQTLMFSPDAKTLATSCGVVDGKAILWDVATGQERERIEAEPGGANAGVQCAVYSPDGQTLALGGVRAIRLWDVKTRRVRHTLSGHEQLVAFLAFSPDGRTLASAGGRAFPGEVRLWEPEMGRPIAVLERPATGGIFSVAFSPDGKTLAAGCADGAIRLWTLGKTPLPIS